ncbi:MAG: MFS transporter [Pseudomonadota bacterium]
MNTQATDEAVTMLPAERRSVGVVALIAMIRMFGLFALLPVLSLYAGDLEGATPLLIGLAVGAYGLTQAGLQIPLGALSDRVGRLPVIVGGLAVFAIGSAVAALSDSIHGVIVGRLLQGAGAISSTLSALVTDATREAVRTRSMAIFGIGIGVSFMFAMVAGPLVAAQFGVNGLFWIAAGLSVVAAGMLRLLPEVPQPKTFQSGNLKPAFRADLLRLDFYVFVLHVIMTATFVALPILLSRKLDLPLTDHWQIYVGALLLSLAITVPLIMRDHRQGKGQLIGLAVLLLMASLLWLTFASFATWSVLIALTLYFGGFNFLEAGLPARLSILADDEVRGASLGVYSSAQFFGAFVGGLIGGRFLGGGRAEDVFFVCALLAAIWLASHGFGRRQHSVDT